MKFLETSEQAVIIVTYQPFQIQHHSVSSLDQQSVWNDGKTRLHDSQKDGDWMPIVLCFFCFCFFYNYWLSKKLVQTPKCISATVQVSLVIGKSDICFRSSCLQESLPYMVSLPVDRLELWPDI